jgi:hypothetical protein
MSANFVVPNEGELQLMLELMGGVALEDWYLCLISSTVAISETNVAATWTAAESSFSGYSRKTLTRSVSGPTWATPASAAPTDSWDAEALVAQTQYNASAPQTWTYGGAGESIYGYFYLGKTSGKLIMGQLYASPYAVSPGSPITIIPMFGGA